LPLNVAVNSARLIDLPDISIATPEAMKQIYGINARYVKTLFYHAWGDKGGTNSFLKIAIHVRLLVKPPVTSSPLLFGVCEANLKVKQESVPY
jgi:protein tyrosine phosphatase